MSSSEGCGAVRVRGCVVVHVVEVVPQQLVDDEEGLPVVEAVEQQRQALLLLLVHLLCQELQQLHLGGVRACVRACVRVWSGVDGGEWEGEQTGLVELGDRCGVKR